MKSNVIVVISFLFCFFMSKSGYGLLNIDLGVGLGIKPTITAHAAESYVPSYGGGVGIDVTRLNASTMMQLRIGLLYSDYTKKNLLPKYTVSLLSVFIGPRFVFANDRFPNWLAVYLGTGIVLVENRGVLYSGQEIPFSVAFGLEIGVEFYLWEGLYLGIGLNYGSNFNYFSVVPVIGYRIR